MNIKVMRTTDVMDALGIGRTKLHELVRAGDFPAPIALGPRRVGWPSDEVESWVKARARATLGRRG